MANLSRLLAISTGHSILYTAQAFSFTHNNPTSCDDLSVSWSGGTAPFYLTLIPVFGTPRNISIPSSSFSDDKGSYSTQLPFSQGQKFVLSMSDETGYGSGGSTEVLSVGASLGGECNTTDPGVSFSFQLNSALQQCRAFTFSDYADAVQPVTIIGTIPGGDSFVLNPSNGPTFDWTVNVWNGTSLIFLMVDSLGRQGGSSNIRTVDISDDNSCINGNSPSSTIGTSATVTATSSSEPSQTSSTSSGKSSTPIGAIAGTVIGALVFLAVFITLGLFLLRRRQYRNHPEQRVQRHSRRMRSDADLLGASGDPYLYSPYSGAVAPATPGTQMLSTYDGSQHSNPFYSDADHSHPSIASAQSPPALPSEHTTTGIPEITPFVVQDSGSSQYSSPAQRKAAMAGVSTYKPSRYIVHTDIEDTPLPEEEEVIELPPQYSERHAHSASGSHLVGSSFGASTSSGGRSSQPPL